MERERCLQQMFWGKREVMNLEKQGGLKEGKGRGNLVIVKFQNY